MRMAFIFAIATQSLSNPTDHALKAFANETCSCENSFVCNYKYTHTYIFIIMRSRVILGCGLPVFMAVIASQLVS